MHRENIDQLGVNEGSNARSVLALQRERQLSEGPPSAAVRLDRLSRLADLLEKHRPRWIEAVNSDFGQRSDFETQMADLLPAAAAIKHARQHLKSWMRPQSRSVALHFLPGRAQVRYQPLGVVGVIAPWNFPVSLSVSPAASAVAAGNRVMIKPSEFTPATSALMKELIEAAFDPSEMAVIVGDESVGRAFSTLPFDHLLFTGATSVGKLVMRAASENLVPVTLELGGKSPVIVDRGYSLQRAAGSIAFGKFVNAGQICISPDYVLVQRDAEDEFIQEIKRAVTTMYPSLLGNNDYTSMINQRHHARVQALLEDAQAKGATVIKINPKGEDFSRQSAFKLPPTLLRGMKDTMNIARDEIFGPVLPIVAYDTLDDAIGYVNARPRPLSLYVFSSSAANQRRVIDRTSSGGVTVNDTLQHYLQDDLPFGGVGPSGMGSYHGFEGFQTFSHKRSVFTQASLNGGGLVRAPYGRIARTILKFMG